MNAACCSSEPGRRVVGRRAWGLAQWLGPGAVLAFLPKCPLCLAAYVAAATGIGLSLPAAANLRMVLIVVCVGSLLYLGLKQLRRFTLR
jgi:hypothetical protein